MVRVAVIGCGLLGIKIAGALAYDGHQVRIHDSNPTVLNKVHLRLNEEKRLLREDGFLLNSGFIGDVYCFSKLEDAVKEVDFIFESVAEDLPTKRDIFKQIESSCSRTAILATCSMRLPIDDIFDHLSTKERCMGVRFLYPVYFIPEVELVPSKCTSLQTLENVRHFLERTGRVGFFRYGCDPIVLNEEQREARRTAFIRQMNEKQGLSRCLSFPIPDLSGLSANQSEPQSNDPPQSSDQTFNRECVVCMDNERDCVLHPCHHLCTCINCGRLLLKRQDACPICRRTITNAFRVYHS